MVKEISIKRAIPRSLSKDRPNFKKGLELNLFFGLFFTIGGAALFLMSAFALHLFYPGLFLLLIGVFGFIISRKAVAKIQLRKQLFINGELVSAKVLKHGRKFNLFKSQKDYTVTIECIDTKKQLELVSGKFLLTELLPVNSEIIGFKKELDYFFPQEIMCKIVVK
jgi:uncharacterized protein YneF (UPF0154 family)